MSNGVGSRPAPGRARQVGRVLGVVALVVLAALPGLSSNSFYLHLAILICLNTIFACGLGLIARAGQLSLCHGAFVGVGAYAGAVLGLKLAAPFWFEVAAATLLCAALAALLGRAILGLRGVYFTLVTFAFGEAVRLLLLDWSWFSGGANGLAGIGPVRLGGFVFASRFSFYLVALLGAAGIVLLLRTLLRSPVGRAFGAVAENAALAEGVGISARRVRMLAFVLGSASAGAGGVLLAHYLGYISPEAFGFPLSVTLITMVVLGGRTSWAGPLLGALFLTPLPELLRRTEELQHILHGLILILIPRLLPQGLAGAVGAAAAIANKALAGGPAEKKPTAQQDACSACRGVEKTALAPPAKRSPAIE